MVSVLLSSVVDRGFDPWLDQTKDNNIQLLTFVEVNIRIYRSKIYDIYRGQSWGKYHISWNDRSSY